ncbi:MAG: DJ-1/PfpI family protein [Ruminococcus sp.]|nr:DJ-1/PfpI family protein [Ruminococcus sp.]MBQ9514823.1 DJ-1/PfpI family protein [Ruminococcus sp.]
MFYVFLADGFEETEAIAPIDILRRAGIHVCTVGVGGDMIRSSHNIYVNADINIERFEINEGIEGVILPGGMPGVTNLYADERVLNAVRYCYDNDLFVCAICAAPSIPGRLGILDGKDATCFPGFEKDLEGAKITGKHVTVDGKIITAKGAGCALEFGFAIVGEVRGKKAADNVAVSMQCK